MKDRGRIEYFPVQKTTEVQKYLRQFEEGPVHASEIMENRRYQSICLRCDFCKHHLALKGDITREERLSL